MSRSLFDKKRIFDSLSTKLNIKFRGTYDLVGWFYVDGKKLIRFKVPKGRGQITPGYQKEIRNTSRLDRNDFDKLISCPMKGPEYILKIRELQQQGLL